ncbi:MAG: UDP-2,4-diacetamido-2,4,6-trideoxy-beta-L-altropyranose hydrolase [Candidatus Zixiibacteriota bacterium]
MKVVIRTDASLEIGTGHVMRCLTLAEQLRARGASTAFVCRELPGHLCDHIESKRYQVHRLPYRQQPPANGEMSSIYSRWLGVNNDEDAFQTIDVLAKKQLQPDWLIVDHYALDARWEKRMRSHVGMIMVIDDLANRRHDADLLLDQNLYENAESRYQRLVPRHCRMFLGPQYALLRPEFEEARQEMPERNGRVKRMLIFFGGVDNTNETLKALQAIQSVGRPDIAVDVVLGISNAHKALIETVCCKMPNVTLHNQVAGMAQLMLQADLAIGGGGTTTWERCCLGLPSLVVAVADNQVAIGRALGKLGASRYLGTAQDVSVARLQHEVNRLVSDSETLRAMSRQSLSLVDGQGTSRVISTLCVISKKGDRNENTIAWTGSPTNG